MKRRYGQATSSHGGKFAYRRKGLLDQIPHRRRIRSVLIVRTEDAGRVVELLRELGAELHTRTVELTNEDCEALGMKKQEQRGVSLSSQEEPSWRG